MHGRDRGVKRKRLNMHFRVVSEALGLWIYQYICYIGVSEKVDRLFE